MFGAKGKTLLVNNLNLVIPGIPSAKQSVRVGAQYDKHGNPVIYKDKKGKRRVLVRKYQPKEIQEQERSIKLIIKEQLPKNFVISSGAIRIKKLHYIFPPLQSFSKKIMLAIQSGAIIYKTTKPDLTDNLNKGLFDAMQGIVFLNDSQICEIQDVKKFYGFSPRVELEMDLDLKIKLNSSITAVEMELFE